MLIEIDFPLFLGGWGEGGRVRLQKRGGLDLFGCGTLSRASSLWVYHKQTVMLPYLQWDQHRAAISQQDHLHPPGEEILWYVRTKS